MIKKQVKTMDRNLSHQPSRLSNLNDTVNQPLDKEILQEYSRLTQHAVKLISKRCLYLKETQKAIRAQKHISTVDTQDLKGMKDELKFFNTVLSHVRNKSSHLIDFDGFKSYMFNNDVSIIYDVVKELDKVHKKYIIQSPPPTNITSIEDLVKHKSNTRRVDKTLQMILDNKITPRLYSEIRFKALEELKKKNTMGNMSLDASYKMSKNTSFKSSSMFKPHQALNSKTNEESFHLYDTETLPQIR